MRGDASGSGERLQVEASLFARRFYSRKELWVGLRLTHSVTWARGRHEARVNSRPCGPKGRGAALTIEPYSYRRDPAVPAFADDKPIIIFDGRCVLCSGFAQFVLRHDHAHRFRLLAAQTPIGEALYRHFQLDPINYESNLLLQDGRVWLKSESSIRIFALLGFPWQIASWFRLLPLGLRDGLYGVIARNRFRWFGRRESCYVPLPCDADRFIG